MANQEIKHSGAPYIITCKVSEGLQVNGHETWRLSDTSGMFSIVCPRQMAPFAKDGDNILTTLVLLKTEIVSTIIKLN